MEVALGGSGGQILIWQEEMRLPNNLEEKDAFLEDDNQKKGPLSGKRGLLVVESSGFLCHCLVLGGSEDPSSPWNMLQSEESIYWV